MEVNAGMQEITAQFFLLGVEGHFKANYLSLGTAKGTSPNC